MSDVELASPNPQPRPIMVDRQRAANRSHFQPGGLLDTLAVFLALRTREPMMMMKTVQLKRKRRHAGRMRPNQKG